MDCQEIILVECGSFNPITRKHLHLFDLATSKINDMKNYRVVGKIISPENDNYKKEGLLPAVHRIAMIEEAIKKKNINLNKWCCEQTEWKPTIDILNHIKKNGFENVEYRLLCGSDLMKTLIDETKWLSRDVEKILKYHGLVVCARDDDNILSLEKFIKENPILDKYRNRIILIEDYCRFDCSSTIVRNLVKEMKNPNLYINKSVFTYILLNNLYL